MEKNSKNNEYMEKLVHINRITKVVKGGRRFGFSALVVVGNQKGKIGIAHAKAKQVPDAIRKANDLAKRKLIQIQLKEGRTIHHDIIGKDGAGKIKLRAAPKGTGIIAGGPIQIEIYHPPLPKSIQLERPDWFVVSEKNIDEFLARLSKIQGVEEESYIPTFFALSPQGYEKMSGNLQEMRRYILEQKEIIVYYKTVTTPDSDKVKADSSRPSIGLYPRDKE